MGAVPDFRVPGYIRRHFERRAALREGRDRAVREAAAKKLRERERVKALRGPPAAVWRVGDTMFWLPPDSAAELAPDGYWISEVRAGGWTKHGDYLRPTFRSAQLFGGGAATVEAYYHGTALGEAHVSRPVERPRGEDPHLVNRVRAYVAERGRPAVYYERWRRVLAGFGVARGKRVRGRMVEPLAPGMTAREAEVYAGRGWGRWVPVAAALARVEAARG